MLYVRPKHNWFEFYAGFLLLKVASALCSHAEAGREPVGGGRGKQGGLFFYPTASPTVAFRNGIDSFKRQFHAVLIQEEGSPDRSQAFQQNCRSGSGKIETLNIPRRLTDGASRENYRPQKNMFH